MKTAAARCACAAVLVAAAAIAGARSGGAVRGPVLIVRTPPVGEARAAADDDEDRAIAIAIASTPPAERTRLLDAMRYTTARLEARLSPLGTDFGEDGGDAVDELRRVMASYLPTFSAARAFARGAWSAPDLEVRAAASCGTLAAGEKCVAMWRATDTQATAERARFLAWAAARAAVADLGSRAAAEACARMLRERAAAPGSPVALALLDDDLALAPVAEREELKEAAQLLGRAMLANGFTDTQHLDAFARAPPRGQVAPWLDLPRTAIVVVPRLSAMADPGALERAIERAAGGAAIRWIHRP